MSNRTLFQGILTLQGGFACILSTGLIAHQIFKRFEPSNAFFIVALLITPPIPLSFIIQEHLQSLSHSLLLSYATYLATLVMSIIFYRLSPFHPLAKYPGPVLCKLTKWWMMWKSRASQQHLYYQKLHNRYGDVVRVGPNELSLRDPAAVAPLMGTTGLPKGPNWPGRSMYPAVQPLIIHRDPVEHAQRRRPWNRAFSTAALKEYQPLIAKRVHELVDILAAKATEDQPVDLSAWISWFTYDFMSDMVFGGGSDMMQQGDGDGLWHVIRDGLGTTMFYDHLPWLPHFVKYCPGGLATAQRMRSIGIERAKVRFKAGSRSKDLFYYLSNEDGAATETPPVPVIVSDGALAMIAGSDTTATVLSNIFYLLIKHPDVYSTLQEEIDKNFGPEDDACTTDRHQKMPYLEAVINEALRLYPAIPSGSQRAPIPGEGDKVIASYHIPEGTAVRVHFWSLHRDDRNFTRAETFWPDRWLIAEGLEPRTKDVCAESASSSPMISRGKGEFKHDPNAFIPFSFGPYNCVGKNLALQEMRILVCQVLQKLRFRFADGWDPIEWDGTFGDKFVAEVGRLPVVIELRQ